MKQSFALHRCEQKQEGAALLVAMLIVALVATFASAAMWQQWRTTALETADRQTSQARWLLTGATGWARVILREDAKAGQSGDNSDNLQEPWAIALQETQLSTFVASLPNSNNTVLQDPLAQKVYLSGKINDLQSRFNLRNLVNNGQIDMGAYQRLQRLFIALDLPQTSLSTFSQNLLAAQQQNASTGIYPSYVSQLGWLGLNSAQIQALEPYITLLPETTKINVNTASAVVLYSTMSTLTMSQAQALVQQRQASHWSSSTQFLQSAGLSASATDTSQIDVKSSYFETLGRLRIDEQTWNQRCALWRTSNNVQTLWCENGQWATF
jgi:general secretion pathway protein K